VNAACKSFRDALELRLADASAAAQRELGWHHHVLTCEACRELLASEEALDALLATLPEPRLPRRLAERLLARLRAPQAVEVEDGLDRLLALDQAAAAGEDVARRVLAELAPERAALARRREAALDALLERDVVKVPDGLAERTLAALADRRAVAPTGHAGSASGRRVASLAAATVAPATHAEQHATGRGRSVALLGARWTWLAAAGLVAALPAWLVGSRVLRTDEPAPIVVEPRPRRELPARPDGSGVPEPDAQLLSALEVLEQWDLLMRDDVDVLLSTLAPADESLLEVESAALPPEEPHGETETDPDRRKG
jgi:hypothetical protein